MTHRRTKPTYPLANPFKGSLVPCYTSIEPCVIDTPHPYTHHIQHSFQLILEDLVEKGTTQSPHAWLFREEPGLKIWKIHWQRGPHNECGPGHCITVFQRETPAGFQWGGDLTSYSVFTIPLPKNA
ncbi:NS7c protein [Pigeon coronavirus UAE-HKU29]|nr:NS7c protein [Houbara coronavirus UAE-HKU28]BBC54849.1 NS7c protein [Pigeon coronavirus UAE-HKU29]